MLTDQCPHWLCAGFLLALASMHPWAAIGYQETKYLTRVQYGGGPASSETWGITMPTSGTYRSGSVVRNRNPAVSGATTNHFIVTGWARLTTGSGHVLGTDWVAMRTLTGT